MEDDAGMRRALAEFVQCGFPQSVVLQAADGAQALEACHRGCPQLVLMDVALPDANGIELIPRIRATLPATRIIVVSQHTAEAYVERARAAGACAYIAKDRVFHELLPAIDRALNGGAAAMQSRVAQHHD
ncbi:MAG: response regulator transcription factor [Burkholderiales bacterium]|nr:response regulator transcription factor [Burkholderiales bacterium]